MTHVIGYHHTFTGNERQIKLYDETWLAHMYSISPMDSSACVQIFGATAEDFAEPHWS